METFLSQAGRPGPPAIPGHDAVRCLGRGAQGQVWLMSPHTAAAPVAAKFLAPAGRSGPGATGPATGRHNESQITHEWRVLAQFHHDHLIAVHGLVQDSEGGQVLLMDHAAGGSLGQIVGARGPLSVGETVTVLTPMGQVLAFLHGRGAVHGDVSPGNVLLSSSGKPLLADFGMGRLLGQGPGEATGTPGFLCPRDTARDEAADVFALAAVGWFALTGRCAPPTRDRLPLGTFVRDVPSELVAALEAGLNEDPAQRPTAAAFAQAVFRSAPAEAIALGHAVHPSVLPELPTRHEPQPRGRRKAGRARPHRAPPRPWPGRGSLRHLAGMLSRRFATAGPGNLAPLWGSRRNRAAPVRRAAGSRALLAGAAVAATLAVASAVLMGGGWNALVSLGAGHDAPGRDVPAQAAGLRRTAPDADLSWAGALPAEIQEKLAAAEPVAALHALAWLRSHALSHGDQALLEQVNVPQSPALAADTAIVRKLLERNHTLTGFETSIVQAAVVPAGAESAAASAPAIPLQGLTSSRGGALPDAGATVTGRAAERTSSFAEQDSAGALVHRQTAAARQELDIVLERSGGRWRIRQILGTGKE